MALSLLFMGTPEFAVPCLQRLAASPYRLLGVVTQPDRPRGRGHKLQPPAVKKAALDLGLPVWQPESIKSKEFLAWLRQLAPQVIVVVAFGRILPPELLAIPPYGCFNVHASLLPRWRGAAPIQRALMSGDTTTGITIMQMDAGLDTGPILIQEEVSIPPDATAGEIHDRLALLGADLLLKALEALVRGDLHPRPQDDHGATYAPPLTAADEVIDWQEDALAVHNRVRALNPFPGARTSWQGRLIKIWRTEVVKTIPVTATAAAGEVLEAAAGGIVVACGRGAVRILELQREGGRRLNAGEFLRGFPLPAGEILGR